MTCTECGRPWRGLGTVCDACLADLSEFLGDAFLGGMRATRESERAADFERRARADRHALQATLAAEGVPPLQVGAGAAQLDLF